MAAQRANFFARLDVPNLNGGVVRPCGEYVVVELQARYAVGVTLKDLDIAPAILPVVANLPTIPVHILPASSLRLQLLGLVETTSLAIGTLVCRVIRTFRTLAIRGNRVQLCDSAVGIILRQLTLSCVIAQPLPFQEWQAPPTLSAFSVHVLFAHLDPNGVTVGQLAPPTANLSCLGEADGIKVAQNLLSELDGEGRYEVYLECFVDFTRDEGELREAELGQNTLKHKLTVASRRR